MPKKSLQKTTPGKGALPAAQSLRAAERAAAALREGKRDESEDELVDRSADKKKKKRRVEEEVEEEEEEEEEDLLTPGYTPVVWESKQKPNTRTQAVLNPINNAGQEVVLEFLSVFCFISSFPSVSCSI
jgi:hypothetical protein